MRSVIFLPGIIAPAAIRYQPLLACLPDVQACPKDLEVYESDAPPADYSIDMEVRALDRTADAAGFERFHLYGHSGGGAVALAYATERAERLLSLALDEPAYDFTPEARAELETFRPVAALPASERMREFMKLQVSSLVELPPPAGSPPPWMARRPAGVAAFLDALERHDLLADRYASVRVPTLFTWGSLTHPRWSAMKERLATRFPDFKAQCFEGLHHLNTSHQAEPARVAELLRAFWELAERRS